jgi:hypothetical protein
MSHLEFVFGMYLVSKNLGHSLGNVGIHFHILMEMCLTFSWPILLVMALFNCEPKAKVVIMNVILHYRKCDWGYYNAVLVWF